MNEEQRQYLRCELWCRVYAAARLGMQVAKANEAVNEFDRRFPPTSEHPTHEASCCTPQLCETCGPDCGGKEKLGGTLAWSELPTSPPAINSWDGGEPPIMYLHDYARNARSGPVDASEKEKG